MKISIYTDGGARGNPGPAAYGYVIYSKDNKIAQHSEFIGNTTNNVAEYTAVLKALEFAQQLENCEEVDFFLDSLLIQKQMTGDYKVKNSTLKEFVEKIKKLESNFKSVTYSHVRREKNQEADALVNKALDSSL